MDVGTTPHNGDTLFIVVLPSRNSGRINVDSPCAMGKKISGNIGFSNRFPTQGGDFQFSSSSACGALLEAVDRLRV